MLVLQTFILAPVQANLRQRVGYYDDNNGLFFQSSGASSVGFVLRSYATGSPVDTLVEQADWNLDTLDGTGKSGLTLDLTKAQILLADFEWLGVGRVRVGFVIDGHLIYVHEFKNANNLNVVYMSNPNLPLSWEIEATGTVTGTPTMDSICGSVSSEGGYETVGVNTSAETPTTGVSVATATNVEILAIRVTSSFREFASVIARAISAINTTGAAFRWRLVHNPTETGAGTWSAVPNSVLEKNTTRTVTVDTGVVLASGFVSEAANAITIENNPVVTLGQSLAGVGDVFSLQIYHLTAQTETFFGSITTRELY
jgi:hypothetical protein